MTAADRPDCERRTFQDLSDLTFTDPAVAVLMHAANQRPPIGADFAEALLAYMVPKVGLDDAFGAFDSAQNLLHNAEYALTDGHRRSQVEHACGSIESLVRWQRMRAAS